MTSYQATLKLYQITQDKKLTAKEYQKEFARLVALGASVEHSPYSGGDTKNLVEHAIYYSNEDAAKFLMEKGYKPSDDTLGGFLVRASMGGAAYSFNSEVYEAVMIAPVKAFMSHGVKPSETHQSLSFVLQ